MPEEVRQYKIVLQEMAMLVKAEVITLEAIVRIYLAGPQGFFVDSFAASTDWYRRLCVGRLEEIGDGVHPIHKGRPRKPRPECIM